MAQSIKKLSIFADRFVPQHIKESNPKFMDFVVGYLRFLETTNGPYDVISKLILDEDISSSILTYKAEYQSKYSPHLPKDSVADPVNIFKQLRSFYGAKGTEDSFKWLFRSYYGTELSFYYPTVDILRCSDGKWYNPLVIHVEDGNGNKIQNLSTLIGSKVIGGTSGDSGIIDGIVEEYEAISGLIIPALSIVSSSSQFVLGERLIISGSSTIMNILPTAGAMVHRDGIWKGTDGQLSSNKRIQDNNYYQDLSYQLNLGLSSDTFRLMTKHAIHPAGRKMFAIVEMINALAKKAGVVNITDNVGIVWSNSKSRPVVLAANSSGFGTIRWVIENTKHNSSILEKTKVSVSKVKTSLGSTGVNDISTISTKWNSDTYFFGNDVGNKHIFNLHDPATASPIFAPLVVGAATNVFNTYSNGLINTTFSSETLTTANTLATFGGITNQHASVGSIIHNVGQTGNVFNTYSNGLINTTFSSETRILSSDLQTFGGGTFNTMAVNLAAKASFNQAQIPSALLIQSAQSDRFNSSSISLNNTNWTFGDTGLQTLFVNQNNVFVNQPIPVESIVSGTIINTFNSDTLNISNNNTTLNGTTHQPNYNISQSINNGTMNSANIVYNQGVQQYGFNSKTSTFASGVKLFNSSVN